MREFMKGEYKCLSLGSHGPGLIQRGQTGGSERLRDLFKVTQ